MLNLGISIIRKCNHESRNFPLSYSEFKIVNIISSSLLDIFFRNMIEIKSSPLDRECMNLKTLVIQWGWMERWGNENCSVSRLQPMAGGKGYISS